MKSEGYVLQLIEDIGFISYQKVKGFAIGSCEDAKEGSHQFSETRIKEEKYASATAIMKIFTYVDMVYNFLPNDA